jgi:hypothetical protein
MLRANAMNARAANKELNYVREGIGAALRLENEVKEPPPDGLGALLKDLQIRLVEADRERLIARVEDQVEAVLRVA